MYKCLFKYPIAQLNQFIRVSELLPSQKGVFSGNENAGNFEIFTPIGHIKGDYECKQEQIWVFIRSKPMLIPCSFIENELKKLLEN
jgi:hypothetical protein